MRYNKLDLNLLVALDHLLHFAHGERRRRTHEPDPIGDEQRAASAGIDFEPRLISLAAATADPARIPQSGGLRLYKSVGAALQDLTIAAIKAEGGFPLIQSVIECDRRFGKEVVISMPIEGDLIRSARS